MGNGKGLIAKTQAHSSLYLIAARDHSSALEMLVLQVTTVSTRCNQNKMVREHLTDVPNLFSLYIMQLFRNFGLSSKSRV